MKLRIIDNVRILILCVAISLIIFLVVVIENTYQNLIKGNADAYSIALVTFFIGLIIFLLTKISPLFGKLILKMFGAEEELRGEQK